MQELWFIVGLGFLPFVISVIYRTTTAGSKKIYWFFDIVALVLAYATYFLVETKLSGVLAPKLHAVGVLASVIVGYIAVAIALPLIYSILYSMGTEPPRPVVAAAPAGHGHADHGHGHGHADHGQGHGGALH